MLRANIRRVSQARGEHVYREALGYVLRVEVSSHDEPCFRSGRYRSLHPATPVPGNHEGPAAHLSESGRSGCRTRHRLGRVGHRHRIHVGSSRSTQHTGACCDRLFAALGPKWHGDRAHKPAGDPCHHGCIRRTGRLHWRRGRRRSLASQAARHEQWHLPMYRLAVWQRRRADPCDPVVADHDLAPCVLDRGSSRTGDRGHPVVRNPRTCDPRCPARHDRGGACVAWDTVQAPQSAALYCRQ
jgi:hypothetical protein